MRRSILLSVVLAAVLQAGIADRSFTKGTTEGYLRFGYESHNQQHRQSDMAIGGKLKFQSASYYGVQAGFAFYTVQGMDHNDNLFIPFYDNNNQSYSLLGEAYLSADWQGATLTIGRQILDTPFADSDDIGMVPNLFEAYTLTGNLIEDTTITVTQIVKMVGVDAPDSRRFTSVNPGNGVQAIGIQYEGLHDTTVSGWYYHAKGIEDILYLDLFHEGSIEWGSYQVGMQYVSQDFSGRPKASIWGALAETTLDPYGVTMSIAYNKIDSTAGATADNFLGGGSFFTSDEHLTLAEAGANGKALMAMLSYDAAQLGADGLTLTLSTLHLLGDENIESDERDFIISYQRSERFSCDLIYSDVDDKKISENTFENIRVLVNYHF